MSISCDKTFLLVPSSRSSVKAKISFQGYFHTTYKIVFTLDITFECYDIGPSYLTCEFIVIRSFCSLQLQCHQSRSRSNIKVTVFERMAVAGAFVFHKHTLFYLVTYALSLYVLLPLSVFLYCEFDCGRRVESSWKNLCPDAIIHFINEM